MRRIALALFTTSLLGGCVTPRSYASLVHRDEGGGVLALEGPDREAAQLDAERVMSEQCGGHYKIVAEDRIRTGERTTSTTVSGDMTGYPLGLEPGYPGYPLDPPPGFAPGFPPGYAPGYMPGDSFGLEPGVGTSQLDSETTPVYEHRLTYRCEPPPSGGAVPPGAPPPLAPAPPDGPAPAPPPEGKPR